MMYNDLPYSSNGEIGGVFFDVLIDIGMDQYLNIDAYQPANYGEATTFMTVNFVDKEVTSMASSLGIAAV